MYCINLLNVFFSKISNKVQSNESNLVFSAVRSYFIIPFWEISTRQGVASRHSSIDIYPLGDQACRRVQTLVLHVFYPTQMSHLHLGLDEAVRVLLFGTVQLLSIFIHVLQHPAAVRRGQLEPHLPGLALDQVVWVPLKLLHGLLQLKFPMVL